MTNAMVTTLTVLIPAISADTTEIPKWAQEKTPIKMSYYLGVGASFPVGDLGDGWKQGFHGYGRMDFSASPRLSIWAGADFHYFALEEVADSTVEGGNISTINLTGDLKINLGTPERGINPYLFAGMGLAIQSISDSSYRIYGDTLVNRGLVSYETKSNALMEIGGGVEYKKFFVHGRYLKIMSDEKSASYIPITFGLKF